MLLNLLITCLVILFIVLKNNKAYIPVQSNKASIQLPSHKPLMFGRVSCPYTVKMITELKKYNVFNEFVYINTETKSGTKLMKKYGGNGVPFFIHKNRKCHGFMSKAKLFEKLNI